MKLEIEGYDAEVKAALEVIYNSVPIQRPSKPIEELRDLKTVQVLLDAGFTLPQLITKAKEGAKVDPEASTVPQVLTAQ